MKFSLAQGIRYTIPTSRLRAGWLAWLLAFAWTAARADDPVPKIDPTDPASIQAAVEKAVARGDHRIVIPPGEYRLPGIVEQDKSRWHLYFRGLRNFEIDATGATLIFTDPGKLGIVFLDCEGSTFRGARIQRENLTTSQGAIEEIDPAGKYVDIRVATGYPDDLTNPAKFDHFWSMLISADGREMLGGLRGREPLNIQPRGPGLFRIDLNEPISSFPFPVTKGMRLSWRGAVSDDIRPQNCHAMKFIDLTVAGASGFAFHEMGGAGGNLYSGCKITYPPRPPGATEDPLFATAADGLHSHDVVEGPTIERCLFEGIGDDAIAIHGTYVMAMEADDRRIVAQVFHETRDPQFCRPGENLRLYDKKGALVGEAAVASVRTLPDYQSAFKPASVYRWLLETSKNHFVEIVLDRPAPADFAGGLISNVNRSGSGYVIRDCTIRHVTARGIMAKGSNGLIEGCTIEDTYRAGIEFMAEMEVWSESDYARNVVVRRNTLRHLSVNRQPGYLRHPGAITIFNYHAVTSDLNLDHRRGNYVEAPGGHRNILIEGNTIEDVNGPNLLITSAQGVTVRDNRFVRPMANDKTLGTEKGIDVKSLVWMTQSSGVQFAGNQVVDPGPHMEKIVIATDSARGAGLETGFQITPKRISSPPAAASH